MFFVIHVVLMSFALGLMFLVFGRVNMYLHAFIFANFVTNNGLVDIGACAIVWTYACLTFI